MNKKIVKVGSNSWGLTISPTFIELLGIDKNNPSNYIIDMTFEDGKLIIKDAKKVYEDRLV